MRQIRFHGLRVMPNLFRRECRRGRRVRRLTLRRLSLRQLGFAGGLGLRRSLLRKFVAVLVAAVNRVFTRIHHAGFGLSRQSTSGRGAFRPSVRERRHPHRSRAPVAATNARPGKSRSAAVPPSSGGSREAAASGRGACVRRAHEPRRLVMGKDDGKIGHLASLADQTNTPPACGRGRTESRHAEEATANHDQPNTRTITTRRLSVELRPTSS